MMLLFDGSCDTGDRIIADPRLPGVTGFDLPERRHSRQNATPVIVVTAFDNPARRERARQLGVKAFFSKPVHNQALVDATQWAIEGDGTR